MVKTIVAGVSLAMVILALGGCAVTTSTSPVIDRITLKRTACYGACPVYTVTIKNGGIVLFKGKEHVQKEGRSTSTITAREWTFLVAALRQANFFTLQDRYVTKADGCTTVVTDSPSLIITVERASKQKQVVYYQGCYGPQAIAAITWLGHTVDRVANTQQWVDIK